MQDFELSKQFEILRQFEQFYDALHPARENTNEAFTWFSGIPHPLFNCVMHLRVKEKPEDALEALIKNSSLKTPLSIWVHPFNIPHGLESALNSKGYVPMITCPLMGWEAKSMEVDPSDIRPISPFSFHQTLASVFQFEEVVKRTFSEIMEKSEGNSYEIYFENTPVGTGTLFCRGKIGALFNISVLPEWQKKGFGKALTKYLMEKAYTLGMKQLILLSSPAAEKLYRDLGFKTYFDIKMFVK